MVPCVPQPTFGASGAAIVQRSTFAFQRLCMRGREISRRGTERELMDDSVKNVLKYSRMRLLVGA